MKSAYTVLGILVVAFVCVLLAMLFGNITVNNQRDYIEVKNATEASVMDSLDYAHYRTGFCLCTNISKNSDGVYKFKSSSDYEILDVSYDDNNNTYCDATKATMANCEIIKNQYKLDKKVFAESVVRRFASSVNGNNDYKIVIQDIIEYPPKVSVLIDDVEESTIVSTEMDEFNILNTVSSLIESDTPEVENDVYGSLKVTVYDVTSGDTSATRKKMTNSIIGIKRITSDDTVTSWMSLDALNGDEKCLEPGNYVLVQTLPSDYWINVSMETKSDFIKNSQKIYFTITAEETIDIVIKNKERAKLSVAVVLKTNENSYLSGASLKYDGPSSETWTSKGDYSTFWVAPGDYSVSELTAPNGYIANSIKVDDTAKSGSNSIKIDVKRGKTMKIKFINDKPRDITNPLSCNKFFVIGTYYNYETSSCLRSQIQYPGSRYYVCPGGYSPYSGSIKVNSSYRSSKSSSDIKLTDCQSYYSVEAEGKSGCTKNLCESSTGFLKARKKSDDCKKVASYGWELYNDDDELIITDMKLQTYNEAKENCANAKSNSGEYCKIKCN